MTAACPRCGGLDFRRIALRGRAYAHRCAACAWPAADPRRDMAAFVEAFAGSSLQLQPWQRELLQLVQACDPARLRLTFRGARYLRRRPLPDR